MSGQRERMRRQAGAGNTTSSTKIRLRGVDYPRLAQRNAGWASTPARQPTAAERRELERAANTAIKVLVLPLAVIANATLLF